MSSGRRANSQRGVLIIWLALFLLLLIGFVSVGIDLAKLGATQGQLQTAADAAALAGAARIDSLTGHIIPAEATAAAIAVGAQNKAFELTPTPVAIAGSDVEILTSQTIRVTARREGSTGMVTHFAAAFLGPVFHKLDMKASATAIVEPAGAVCCNIIPMAAVPTDAGPFVVGCPTQYILKEPGGSGTNGNYGLLDLPACDQGVCAGMNPNGAATVKCLIANGYCCCLTVGQKLDTEPGAKSGPVRQGLQTRWDNDSDRRDGICYEQYTGNGQRVVVVPVVDGIDVSGKKPVTLQGFATFFLKERPGGGAGQPIVGEFIHDTIFGTGNGPPNSLTFTVHLVR